jgi:beta-glucosidase
LSYTTFKYSGLKITADMDTKNPSVTVEFEIKNTGKREGAEAAQIYVQELNPSVTRPIKELKGFAKVPLKPGEKQKVSVRLDRSAFAFYDPAKNGWVAEKGDFKILVGGSSRDLPLNGNYRLRETVFEKD